MGLHDVGRTGGGRWKVRLRAFRPRVDNFELGNQYGKGDRRPLLTRLSACLPPATSVLPRTEHGDFSTLSLVSHSKAIQSKIPRRSLHFFPQCYPFLIKPSFCYPRFVSFLLPVFFFRPLLHAPQYAPQQPPPLAYPYTPSFPFLCVGHDHSGEPALRRICPRIRAKRSHPHPCPNAETNAPPCVTHYPP